MKRLARNSLLAAVALGLAACGGPKQTTEKLRVQIADYKTNPSEQVLQEIEANFAKLDAQIARLKTDGKQIEASGYESTAENLRADFRAARMVQTLREAQKAIEGVGEAFKDAGKSIGNAFREVTEPNPEESPSPSP